MFTFAHQKIALSNDMHANQVENRLKPVELKPINLALSQKTDSMVQDAVESSDLLTDVTHLPNPIAR